MIFKEQELPCQAAGTTVKLLMSGKTSKRTDWECATACKCFPKRNVFLYRRDVELGEINEGCFKGQRGVIKCFSPPSSQALVKDRQELFI